MILTALHERESAAVNTLAGELEVDDVVEAIERAPGAEVEAEAGCHFLTAARGLTEDEAERARMHIVCK